MLSCWYTQEYQLHPCLDLTEMGAIDRGCPKIWLLEVGIPAHQLATRKWCVDVWYDQRAPDSIGGAVYICLHRDPDKPTDHLVNLVPVPVSAAVGHSWATLETNFKVFRCDKPLCCGRGCELTAWPGNRVLPMGHQATASTHWLTKAT